MLKVANYTSEAALAAAYRIRHKRLKDQIFASESESDVRQGVLALYDLDLVGNLEKHRIDYVHPEIFIEFKFNVDFGNLQTRCKIIAQILHYIHQIPTKRGEYMLPESFAIIDKTYALFYDTIDFAKYIIDAKYFDGIGSPSSRHPLLEDELIKDIRVKAKPFHVLADYDLLWDEFEKRGAYG
ncbi:hypothetical protein VPHD148_0129 [Vibrio phage D148]